MLIRRNRNVRDMVESQWNMLKKIMREGCLVKFHKIKKRKKLKKLNIFRSASPFLRVHINNELYPEDPLS